MWKTIIFIAVIGYGLYWIANRAPAPSEPSEGKTLKELMASNRWFVPEDGEPREGFAEVRLLMRADGNELEIVTIVEQPGEYFCDPARAKRNLKRVCGTEVECSVKKVSCTTEIEPRFRNMLDQKPANVRYAHIAGRPWKGKPRQLVLLAWGLTEAQSTQLCKMASTNLGPDERATCI